MIKWVLIGLLILAGFSSKSGETFTQQIAIAKDGRKIIRIISHVNYVSYCRLYNADNSYFIDWHLKPGTASKWYYLPRGQWGWICS